MRIADDRAVIVPRLDDLLVTPFLGHRHPM
jgi:hypothetical protein